MNATTISLLTQAAIMVSQAKAANQKPLVFVMNQSTADTLLKEQLANRKLQKSLLTRLWEKVRAKPSPETLRTLYDVAVAINPHFPDGVMTMDVARPIQLMGLAPEAAGPQPAQQMGNAAAPENGQPMEEFLRREAVKATDPPEGAPTLEDLAKGDGITPTALLIKAMENIERVKGIMVIRLYHSDNVDLCTNCDEISAIGLLDKAQLYLRLRG